MVVQWYGCYLKSSDRIPKMILKYQPKGGEEIRQTFEKMEGLSFV
jgi:hypothetical protein